MATIVIEDCTLLRSVLGYLLDKGSYEALNSLLLEANFPIFDSLPNEFLHLQRMILQGRWNDILTFVGPLSDANGKIGKEIKLLIGKQQFLESLSWQGGGVDRWIYPPWRPNHDKDPKLEDNVELNTLIALLNSLKPLCSVADFNSLCLFLTLERLEDHPEYAHWSVASGRYNCCVQMLKLLLDTFQQTSTSSLISHSRFLKSLVSVAVEDVITQDTQKILRLDYVAKESGEKAIHLQNLEDLLPLVDKRNKTSRILWNNEVKVQSRSLTSPHAMTLTRDLVHSASIQQSSSTSSLHGSGTIINRQNLEVDNEPQYKSSMEFGSTLAWPSAMSEKGAGQPLHLSEEDPFASSQDLYQDHRSISSNQSRPSTQQKQVSAEGKKAMSWTVDVSDVGAGGVSAPNTGNSRKSLHSRDSSVGRRASANQNHDSFATHTESLQPPLLPSQRPTTSNLSSVTPRQTGNRDALEHDSSAINLNVRASHGKVPGLTSPYTSQDVTAQPSASSNSRSPSRSRGSTANRSPSKSAGARSSASSSSAAHDASPVSKTTRKGVIWDEPCPLRCISILDENPSDGAVTIAVGTNAKAVHLLQFRPRDLDKLAEDTFRGAAASGTEIIDVDGIVQDLTEHVQHIYTFEKVHNGSVYAMDYHRSAAVLATVSNDKAVRVIKPNTRQLCTAMKGHTGTIRVVKFAPELYPGAPAIAASAGAGDFRPRLWDIQAESCQRILSEHKTTIHSLVWLNDHVLVTGCEAGVMTAHDVRDQHPIWSYSLAELLQQTPEYRDTVARSICALEYIPQLTSPSSKVAPSAFIPPSMTNVLAVGCLDGSVSFVQADSNPAKVLFDLPRAHTADVRTILALPDYEQGHRQHPLLFSASYDSTANIWGCVTPQRRIDPALQLTNRANLRAGHTDKVLCAAALNSNASIITSGADGRVVLWNLPY